LTDLDFADNIALLSDENEQAQELLLKVEKECKKVGLGLNARKQNHLLTILKILIHYIHKMVLNLNDKSKLDSV